MSLNEKVLPLCVPLHRESICFASDPSVTEGTTCERGVRPDHWGATRRIDERQSILNPGVLQINVFSIFRY